MRRIKRARVQRLALCKRGKNGLATLFKSDGTAEWQTLVKAGEERGEVLAVAYPLDHPDMDGDFADTMEAIESMAHSFLREGAQLDIEHDGEELAKDAAYVKESFIIQPGDERFAQWPGYDGKPVDVTGGWAVKLQIDDPNLREGFRNGEWDGVSLFGPAAVEQVENKAASQRIAARMGGGKQEKRMDKEELQAVLKEQNDAVVSLFKSAVKDVVKELRDSDEPAAPKPKPKSEPKAADIGEPPVFEGDPGNAEDLANYERALRTHEMRKSLASGELTADKIAEMRKSLSETQPTIEELNEAGIKAEEGQSPEVRALQAKLFKSMKGSNAPARGADHGRESEQDMLAKACEDEGKAIADLVNKGNAGGSTGFRVVSA